MTLRVIPTDGSPFAPPGWLVWKRERLVQLYDIAFSAGRAAGVLEILGEMRALHEQGVSLGEVCDKLEGIES